MIEAKQLTKKFGTTVALNGITFTIGNGSVFGLVGSNGAGKSTFLRTAAGVYKPDEGPFWWMVFPHIPIFPLGNDYSLFLIFPIFPRKPLFLICFPFIRDSTLAGTVLYAKNSVDCSRWIHGKKLLPCPKECNGRQR